MDTVLIAVIVVGLCIVYVVCNDKYKKKQEEKRKAEYQAKLDKMTPEELDREMKRLQKESDRIMHDVLHRN